MADQNVPRYQHINVSDFVNFFLKSGLFIMEGLTYSHGETFLHLKRILEKATFRDGVGDKPLETRIIEEASSCIKVLGNIAESGEEVFLEKLFKTFFLNLMYGVIFGKRLQYGDERLSTWVTLIDEMKSLSKSTLLADMLPCLSFLPSARTSKELLKKLVLTRQMIQDSVKEHENSFNPKNPSDVIDLYLEEKKTGVKLSDLNICGLILDTLYANTNGEKFIWLIAYMIGYPDILAKCREEINKAIRQDRYVTSDDISRLPYTYATMHEAIRYGGTQITIPHATLKDTSLSGYCIPKNTIMIVNMASIHLDPVLFEDPLVFRPERFLDENGKFKKLDHYNPYGIGTRKCTSWDTADRSMFIFFANIMKRFEFELPEGQGPIDLRGIQVAPHIPFKPKPFLVKINKVDS